MSVDEKSYRVLVMALCHSQIQLEVMDEVKETPLYRHSIKKNMKILEKDLEKLMKGDFAEVYTQDSDSFSALSQHIQMITKWVSHAKFEDIMDLGKALENDEIKFVDK